MILWLDPQLPACRGILVALQFLVPSSCAHVHDQTLALPPTADAVPAAQSAVGWYLVAIPFPAPQAAVSHALVHAFCWDWVLLSWIFPALSFLYCVHVTDSVTPPHFPAILEVLQLGFGQSHVVSHWGGLQFSSHFFTSVLLGFTHQWLQICSGTETPLFSSSAQW